MPPLAPVISATRPPNDPSMTRACHTGTTVPGRHSGRKEPGGEVTRPRRCTCSQRADHHISSLPPAGLCRDDRLDHQSRPGADAPSARPYTRCRRLTKRHCAAPGFTDSGQRRFSTHFSAQRGKIAESRGYFSWSRCPVEVTDPSLLPASQAGHAGSIPVVRVRCAGHRSPADRAILEYQIRLSLA